MPCCKVLGDRVVRFWLMNWLKSTTKNAAKQFGILFCSVFSAEREGLSSSLSLYFCFSVLQLNSIANG